MNAAPALASRDWRELAACREEDGDDFFPVAHPLSEAYAIEAARALAVCAGCTVRPQCAKAGAMEMEGVWGATLPADRIGGILASRRTLPSRRSA